MAATINTNIASINAQRNLALSGQSLNTTMQRLSSGLRVNSAKDDAAGLAIAERMNTQVKGLTVASRNANDGISLAQTAEGALGKVGDMLQRMRELAVQASNATNSDSDRKALQAEVSQLAAEIDRVAKQTNFNGQKILDGSFAGAVFQVGANSGDNVTLGALADTRSSKLSNVTYATNTLKFDTQDDPAPAAILDFDQEIKANTLKVQVGDLPAIDLGSIPAANSSLERLGQVITAINNKTADTGVTAYMTQKTGTQEYSIEFMASTLDENNQPQPITFTGFTAETTGLIGGPSSITLPTPAIVATPATGYPVNNSPTVDSTEWAAFTTDQTSLEDLMNKAASNPSIQSSLPANFSTLVEEYNRLTPTDENHADAEAKLAAATAILSALEVVPDFNAAVAAKETWNLANNAAPSTAASDYGVALQALRGAATITPAFDFDTVTNPDATAEQISKAIADLEAATGLGGLDIQSYHAVENARGIDQIDVTTQAGAWIALKKIDSAIDQVNSARATLGAMQTRFENAVNNIDIQVENLSAARGRIVDADFAVETANLSRTQILQQAGTAMVAQANQIPQNVLQLLQG